MTVNVTSSRRGSENGRRFRASETAAPVAAVAARRAARKRIRLLMVVAPFMDWLSPHRTGSATVRRNGRTRWRDRQLLCPDRLAERSAQPAGLGRPRFGRARLSGRLVELSDRIG